MVDIDLIPGDYRIRIWLQGRAKLFAAAIASLLVITAIAYTAMQFTTGKLTGRISELQKQQAISAQQSDAITRLSENKQSLEHKLALLNSQRSGAAAQEMFATIDRAMSEGDVWFENWEFRRAGTSVEQKEEISSNGYFIILPAGNDATDGPAWKIETHMTIKGQAKDHSALSRFVRRLYKQPEIHNIKILNTTTPANLNVVDFNLAVTVNSSGASS
jgi:cell division protein FtsB